MAMKALDEVRAGCYCRISSDPQDKRAGVDRQREDTAVMCEVNGWTPVGFYVDNDRSSTNGDKRPEWERLLADMRAGEIDAVVVWNQDRGWRKMADLEDLRPAFASLGVRLATTNVGTIDFNNPDDIFRVQVSTALSEMEVAKMRVRQLRAHRQRAERGVPQGRHAFGYLSDYTPDPVTAPLVRQAYEAVIRGEKITAIAASFNKAGALGGNGKPWSASTMSLFLRKPRNCGLRSHNGVIVGDGNWEGLVDRDTWEAAQTVMARNVHAPKSVRKHLLTGVLRCGKAGCDGHLSGNWVRQAGNPDAKCAYRLAYACKTCRGVSVRAEHVEPLLQVALVERLSRSDAAKLLRKTTFNAAEDRKLRNEERVLRAKLAQLGKDFASAPPEFTQAALADVQAKLDALADRQQDQDRRRVLDGIPLGTAEVGAAITALTPDRYRAVWGLLATITVLPVGKGGHAFDPDRIDLAWR
jgi:DNA invertase Pin-like site-specific DNA recombinase